MTYVVVEACIKCKLMDCVEVCPVDCFYEGENMLVIHPDECIDCGVCEPECPVDAILPDIEGDLSQWVEHNAGFGSTPSNGPGVHHAHGHAELGGCRRMEGGARQDETLQPQPGHVGRLVTHVKKKLQEHTSAHFTNGRQPAWDKEGTQWARPENQRISKPIT